MALGRLSLVARLCLLAAVVLLAAVPTGSVAFWWYGSAGLLAAVVAAGVCLAGGFLALVAGGVFRGPQSALAALLVGMGFRMALPLAIGLLVHTRVPVLAESGFLAQLLIFYLLVLAVETLLEVARLRATSAGGPAAAVVGPLSLILTRMS